MPHGDCHCRALSSRLLVFVNNQAFILTHQQSQRFYCEFLGYSSEIPWEAANLALSGPGKGIGSVDLGGN
ncbi:hypothetical protein AQB9606_02991 [Aquabacterium sp. CECT 9606]|nr:hypothetical protein AQB9606_02991 [Aquabacterium sp. CECT 9606]